MPVSNDPGPNENDNRYRRNLFHLALIEGGWGFGGAFLSLRATLPLAATALGATASVVGLLPAVATLASALPQLVAARAASRLEGRLGFLAAGNLLSTLPFLPLAAVLAWSGPGAFAVSVMYGCLALWFAGQGCVAPVWIAMVGELSGPGRRGRTFGVLSTVDLLAGAAGAWLAGRLFSVLEPPVSYAVGALVALGMFNLFNLLWRRVEEPPVRACLAGRGAAGETLREYLARLLGALRTDAPFRRLMLVAQLGAFHAVLGAFYLVDASERFGAGAGLVMAWTSVTLLFEAAGSLLFAALGDRIPPRVMMLAGLSAAQGAMACTLSASRVEEMWTVSALLGLFYGTYFNAKMAAILDAAGERDASSYVALSSLLSMPAGMLVPAAAGWLIELAGYLPVLAGALAMTLLGSAVLLEEVRELAVRTATRLGYGRALRRACEERP